MPTSSTTNESSLTNSEAEADVGAKIDAVVWESELLIR